MIKGKKAAPAKKGNAPKKPKKKKDDETSALSEVQKTFYELTITDLNRKLARLRTFTHDLEDKNKELVEARNKTSEDLGDVIIFLKRSLYEKTEECNRLQERVDAVDAKEKESEQLHEKELKKKEEEFEFMKTTLSADLKLLEGQLNSMRDFMFQRNELMEKFEKQENEMEAQELRHKQEIYDMERKYIVAKDKLKKDMEAKLFKLSTDFQNVTELRIAATTHRVIRENISINTELDEMLTLQQKIYNERESMKRKDRDLRESVDILTNQRDKALVKTRIQDAIIHRITEEQQKYIRKYEELKKVQEENFKLFGQIKERDERLVALQYKIRILEQNLHRITVAKSNAELQAMFFHNEANRFEQVISQSIGIIRSALKVQYEFAKNEQAARADKCVEFLRDLFVIVNDAAEIQLRKPSLTTLPSVGHIYEKGDLNFEPMPAAIRQRVPVQISVMSQVGSSLYTPTPSTSISKRESTIKTSLKGFSSTYKYVDMDAPATPSSSDRFYSDSEEFHEESAVDLLHQQAAGEEIEGEDTLKTIGTSVTDQAALMWRETILKSSLSISKANTSQTTRTESEGRILPSLAGSTEMRTEVAAEKINE